MSRRNRFPSLFGGGRNKRKRRLSTRRWLPTISIIALALFVVITAGSVMSLAVFAFYSSKLPSPDKLTTRARSLSTKIYDRNGDLLYDVHGDQNRTLVQLEDVPEHLVQATLATEDADFYAHKGFDPLGILRAFYNVIFLCRLQGGSTITQQVVRNTVISRERTLTRKIKELMLALQIERKYGKDEILQMYLNEAPYGGQAYGVQAASEVYFSKDVQDLTLAESAFMAGMTQAPSRYSPYRDPDTAKARRDYVLHLMQNRGWLGKDGKRHFLPPEEAEVAKETKLIYTPPGGEIKAPHFVMYVKELLTDRYGASLVEQGGLKVTTTLDLEKQEEMQTIVAEEIANVAHYDIGNGALLAMDPQTGEILAMVGSKNFFAEDYDGQVNVTLRPRQPGSSIKPITYATAFKQGYTPASVLFDVPTKFPGGSGQPDYEPENYDGKFRGPVKLRYALGNSINLVAVKLLRLVGVREMIETAHDLGITTLNEPERYGLSLTLGGGEVKLLDLVTAYSGFANEGRRVAPQAILEVSDSNGRVLEEFKPTEGPQVLSPEVAYLVSDILSDNNARTMAFGPHSSLHIPGYSVAVKTGTTNEMKDNWTVGYTPSIAIGVWVGNNDNSSMSNVVSGITGAAPIWNRAINVFLEGKSDEPFERPDGIVEEDICNLSGQKPHQWCYVPGEEESNFCDIGQELFIKGTEPTEVCGFHKKLELCKVDGKLASDACREADEVKEKIFVDYQAALSDWQEYVDDWVEDQYGDDDTYDPPTEESESYIHSDDKDEPWVQIKEPGDTVSQEFKVKVKVITPYTVTKVKFYLNDKQVGKDDTSIPYEQKMKIEDTTVAEHTLKVKAYDSAGNVGEATKDIILKDVTPAPGEELEEDEDTSTG
ncbi:MAG: PBP1A family penicillin-binding protein [Patescibacteria group bacterium]|nr:PBP1A family penicillin-binding protein [Patescibacteria group bacterium]